MCIIDSDFPLTKEMTEQKFKTMFFKVYTYFRKTFDVFPIETEETVAGFPDVILIHKVLLVSSFMEFKYTKNGIIKFQPTQPAFYRKHSNLSIIIVAGNAQSGKIHQFSAKELFKAESPYCLDSKGTINLNQVELSAQKEKEK